MRAVFVRHYPCVYLVVPPGGCFREPRRVELGPRPLVIGRGENCDIRVDVPGVDPEHAKISEIALVALGADCAIGDVPLDPGARRLVMPGDEIQIGSVVVALEGDDPSDVKVEEALGRPRQRGPRVRVVEGQDFGDELVLAEEGRDYLIGRSPKCDLNLEDREVSREHVKLVRRGYDVFIQDLSSTRGSWLGRSNVYSGATVAWTRPRMLRVGATVLSLELPQEIRKVGPAAQASAPMTPEPRPRGGSGSSRPPPGAPAFASAGGPLMAASVVSSPSVSPPPQLAMKSVPAPAESTAGRKAWKASGPSIGRASGLLLLALVGLAILGALFVVFSLLE